MYGIKCNEHLLHKKVVKIHFFDSFSISMDDKTLDEKEIRSDKIVKLLSYLIYNRKKAVSVSECADILWENSECDNPEGALKNLIYRLRKILFEKFGEFSFITTLKGAYQWNDKLQTITDCDLFLELCQNSFKEKDIKKRIVYEENAHVVYWGKFLHKAADDYWIMLLEEYYHSMYITLSKQYIKDLEVQKEYEKMEKICLMTLSKEKLDEQLHYYLMKSYIYQNKKNLAKMDYKNVKKMLEQYMGVSPARELKELLMQEENSREGAVNV